MVREECLSERKKYLGSMDMVRRMIDEVRRGIWKASRVRLGSYFVREVNKRKETYRLHYPNDLHDLRRKLLPADVLLVEGESGASDWIKLYSSHTWSHCALYVGDQSRLAVVHGKPFVEDQPTLVEAIMGRGVILGNLQKYEACNLRICRPRHLTRVERETVIRWVLSKVGLAYDLENVLQFMNLPFDETVPPALDIGESSGNKYTCSSLIAAAFGQVNMEVLHDYDRVSQKIVPYHYSQIQPKDFDLSPYFDVIKIHPPAYRKPRGLLRQWLSGQQTA
jgi:hypothetical protein